jgi:spore germination protein
MKAFRESSLVSTMFAASLLFTAGCLAASIQMTDLPTAAPSITPTALPIATQTPTATVDKTMRLGYYTPDQYSLEALSSYAPWLTAVSVDIYGVDSDGQIIGSDEFGVVDLAHRLNLEAYLCISNYNSSETVADFDPALARAAIIDHRDSLIPALVNLAVEKGYEGINIDFESLAMTGDLEADRAALSDFIRLLALQAHQAHLKLIISTPAKTGDDPSDDWSYPFDLAELGKQVDYIQYMTYDEHGPWGDPGPVSGYDWVKDSVTFAAGQTDPSKILIGLPAYGYDWVVDENGAPSTDIPAGSFGWNRVAEMSAEPSVKPGWDEDARSPYLTYSADGLLHLAWFENAESIRAKVDLVSTYHLGGLSVWSLGQEDESFWQAAVGER